MDIDDTEPHRDGGQALVLVVIAVAVIAALAAGLVRAGARLLEHQRARNAADAAALAAVSGGEPAARRVAGENGAQLLSIVIDARPDGSTTVTVLVGVDGEQAQAAASNAP